MNKPDLLKELRSLTQAGMKDCHDALLEADNDLQKAVDIIKKKGQNITSGRDGRVAAEGLVFATKVVDKPNTVVMVEVNCQTDFVSRSPDFKQFGEDVLNVLSAQTSLDLPFDALDPAVTDARVEIVNKTKENCVVRRWWVEEVFVPYAKVFYYIHNGNQIGSILTLVASSENIANSPEFDALGADLVMQVAAMNPIAISVDKLPVDELTRQKSIFAQQLKEMHKPEASHAKILEGKLNKWYKEVCLLEQDSVVVSNSTVKKVIDDLSITLGGTISISTMIRCQVGEGLVKEKSNLADEVNKLTG